MRLVVFILLAALVFAATALYCFRNREISGRPGAFYLLMAAVACEALLVSAVAVEATRLLRGSLAGDERQTGDLLGHSGSDPSAAELALSRRLAFEKPNVWTEETLTNWQLRLRDHLREQLYKLDSLEIAAAAREAQLRRSMSDDGLIRKEFEIPALGGDSIPAVLLIREGAHDPVPGILMLHGHVKSGESGLAQMVLEMDSYHQSAARRLARAGFATMTVELRGFGMRGPPDFPDHRIVAYNAMLAGTFYKKVVFDDIARTLEVFRGQPEVDADRVGIAGVSLGGELAVEFAALEPAIRAISFHSHGGGIGRYKGLADAGAAQPHYCHFIPGVSSLMEKEDPFLLLAPRPVQGVRGKRQPFGGELPRVLTEAWAVLGQSNRLDVGLAEADARYRGHAFFIDEAVRFFEENLQ